MAAGRRAVAVVVAGLRAAAVDRVVRAAQVVVLAASRFMSTSVMAVAAFA